MRSILWGTVAAWIVGAGGSWAADLPQAEQTASASASAAGTTTNTQQTATVAPPTLDELPWNPDVCHANEWPYHEPLHIDTDYCGPPGEFWVRGEFLLWGLKGDRLPPLVTANPAGSGVVLGQPGVGSLFGGSISDPGPYEGGRFTAGVWFNSCYTCGVEVSGFFLANREDAFAAGSAGLPGSQDLGRPFLNVLTGQPNSLVLASSGLVAGSVIALAMTELNGAEANLVGNVWRSPSLSINLEGGFRYLYLRDELTIADSTIALGATPVPGSTTFNVDSFTTRNHFYGGQIGLRAEYCWRCLAFTLTEKLALGMNTANVTINGYTLQNAPGCPVAVTSGGLLTQPSNIGDYWHDSFAVVNELGVQAGWQIHDYVQLFVGYTFLCASSVARAGDAVDFGVNPAQAVGGPARPAFAPRETGFWAQGLNVGVEFRY